LTFLSYLDYSIYWKLMFGGVPVLGLSTTIQYQGSFTRTTWSRKMGSLVRAEVTSEIKLV